MTNTKDLDMNYGKASANSDDYNNRYMNMFKKP